MFSPTVQTLGLLNLDPHTNIVSVLTKEIQISIIHQVSGYIVNNLNQFQASLNTEEHCKWMMEIIGAGLRLPVECFETIGQCVKIYESWFILQQYTPQPIVQKFKEFKRVVCEQLTLVLCKRETTPQNFNVFPKYCELCKKVISILRVLSKSLEKQGGEVTRMFRLVIGCVQDVCGCKWSNEELVFISPVAGVLIRFFYEMWVEHSNEDCSLVKLISKLHPQWIKINTIALEWVKIAQYIQSKYLDTLYITKLDNGVLSLKNEEYDFTLTTSSTSLLKMWLHFIHFCGNVANITNPDVLELVEEGFYNLIVQMISYTNNKNIQQPPDGNIILSIYFDTISFPVIYLSHHIYFGAILFSLKTLFLIINTFAFNNTIDQSYLIKIYHVISFGIDTQNSIVLSFILKQLPSLFKKRLPGIEVLYPNLMVTMERYCASASTSKDQLLDILSLLQLIQLSFSQQWETIMIPTIPRRSSIQFSYHNLIEKTRSVLFSILKTSKDPDVLDSLLLSFNRFLLDYVTREFEIITIDDNSPDFVLQEFIKEMSQNGMYWFECLFNAKKYHNIIELLRTLNQIIPCLSSPQGPFQEIFQVLSNFVELNYKTCENIHPVLSVYALFFSKCYPNLPSNVLIASLRLCSKICSFFNSLITNDPMLAVTYKFDSELMSSLFNNLMPESFKDNIINEVFIYNLFKQYNITNIFDHFQIFFDSHSVISYIDLPWTMNNEFCDILVISRTAYFKQTYIIRYLMDNEQWTLIKNNINYQEVTIGYPCFNEKETWTHQSILFNLDHYLNPKPAPQKHASLHLPNLKHIVQESSNFNCSPIRLFCMSIHLMEISHMNLIPLNTNEKLLNELVELDSVATKITGNVELKIKQNNQLFVEFVSNLGTLVDGETFVGYKGKYDKESMFVCNSNSEMDVIYNIPSIYATPNEAKGKEEIVIEWKERNEIQEYSTLKHDDKLYIIIEHDNSDIFRVLSNKCVGPMLNVQYISLGSLGLFIKLTCEAYLRQNNGNISQINRRAALEVIKSYSDDLNPHAEIHMLFNESFRKSFNTSELNFTLDDIDLPLLSPTTPTKPRALDIRQKAQDNPEDLTTSPTKTNQVKSNSLFNKATTSQKPQQDNSCMSKSSFAFKKIVQQQEKQQQQIRQLELLQNRSSSSEDISPTVIKSDPQPIPKTTPTTPQNNLPSPQSNTTSVSPSQTPKQHVNMFQSAPVVSSFQKRPPQRGGFFTQRETNKQAKASIKSASNYPQVSVPLATQAHGQYSYQKKQETPQQKHNTTGWQMGGTNEKTRTGHLTATSRGFVMGDRRSRDITPTQQEQHETN
ncbi:hypothetical protein EHI8A_006890 [Entamoeba histolytica HM-1:IMSS-B]|uniref:Rap-GAP domain-containing protein n=4 Tax=Entamoeba histolytica TaxID=5759 RepID=C4LZR1_ENTH1|nr:hypothetical protein EHI_038890 [Entamoeba histolytica HM-1:IMSS]EAL51491.1 hypothetical protein EHI_038890 [Entamoeba histolytica HM-1:IMSS]EMH75037.1 hypothetical protein EHI8A_006890 [Entamoeba histolytica HM-1:IMSS-B]ENY64875.1 hypothetical protein EHI7A_009410 [Entamoeba histolytica HM-1:IMSS-A]GAT94366.1 hypothetical protein CL6EHI_038890 [Entamoeba histolytica]|eukprot:XP_656877.1 hypothetical protein EHI_038890 [Entamoeba histolytica HM-1:IMSS]